MIFLRHTAISEQFVYPYVFRKQTKLKAIQNVSFLHSSHEHHPEGCRDNITTVRHHTPEITKYHYLRREDYEYETVL